jgi:hypothetical protein
MNISEKRIEEFKKLYQKNFNEQISSEEAQNLSEKLISLVKLVYRPITKM